jgi:hypothetical protein
VKRTRIISEVAVRLLPTLLTVVMLAAAMVWLVHQERPNSFQRVEAASPTTWQPTTYVLYVVNTEEDASLVTRALGQAGRKQERIAGVLVAESQESEIATNQVITDMISEFAAVGTDLLVVDLR